MSIFVGKPAPDFETAAFHKGKWVVICFCPGDFTFV